MPNNFIMKNFIKISIAIIGCCIFYNVQAQPLSKADLKIIKEIQYAIVETAFKTFEEFNNLSTNIEIAKDTEVIEYKAKPIALMHAQENEFMKFTDGGGTLYACSYTNAHSILLAHKAILGMVNYGTNNYTLTEKLEVQKNTTGKYLSVNDKTIGYFLLSNDNKFLNFYFLRIEKNKEKSNEVNETKNSADTFTSNLAKTLDSIDTSILISDSRKIADIQIALYMLIGKGEEGFPNMVDEETSRDKSMIYYKATSEDDMKAQTYQAIKLLPKGSIHFVCGYSKASDVSIAMQAIYNLPSCNNAVWKLENIKLNDTNLVGKKIFEDDKYVGYTTYVKNVNEFYIAIKDNFLYAVSPKIKKSKVILKKKNN